MNRFFAFGCSFTQNTWTTWADCLGPNFDLYENWGRCGAGNHFIFNSVIECNQRNRFTKDDTVIVQWTNCLREDRYLNLNRGYNPPGWPPKGWENRSGWVSPGNLASQSFYNDDFIRKFLFGSEKGFFLRDIAYITSIKLLLESSGCNWRFLTMMPMVQFNQSNPEEQTYYKDIIDVYQSTLDSIKPSFLEVIFNGHWNNRRPYRGIIQDCHPLPHEAVEYLEKVLPEFPIESEIKEYCQRSTEHLVSQHTPYPHGDNRLSSMVGTRL